MKQDSSHTDKWDILLDLLENPTAYSETQKNEILGDEETLEMYRQIVNVHQALDSQKKDEEIHLPSMDEEWEKLKEKKLGNMGINPNEKIPAKTVTLWSPMRKIAAIVAVLVVSGFTFAAIHLAYHSFQTSSSHDTNMAKRKQRVRILSDSLQQQYRRQVPLMIVFPPNSLCSLKTWSFRLSYSLSPSILMFRWFIRMNHQDTFDFTSN